MSPDDGRYAACVTTGTDLFDLVHMNLRKIRRLVHLPALRSPDKGREATLRDPRSVYGVVSNLVIVSKGLKNDMSIASNIFANGWF
jgi:hypothetical protein